MRDSALTCTEPFTSSQLLARQEGDLWAVVLAGGEGVRLRSLTRQLYGEPRPKQYAVLTGTTSLLRQTLDRVALLVPPERTVIVTLASHARYLAGELTRSSGIQVLAQPSDRGTAAGVLLPAHWISARDPRATVVVFPADHFIVEDTVFMRQVALAARYARAYPEPLVLLGAQPTEPDVDYGWIEPGERLDSAGLGPIHRVRGLWERPSEALARTLFDRGCLWNTLVVAASAAALVDAGRRCVPLLHDRLTRLALFIGTPYEPWGLRQAYQFAPTADFCRAILESCPSSLAVTEVPAGTWCDLETAERVASSVTLLSEYPARGGNLASGA